MAIPRTRRPRRFGARATSGIGIRRRSESSRSASTQATASATNNCDLSSGTDPAFSTGSIASSVCI